MKVSMKFYKSIQLYIFLFSALSMSAQSIEFPYSRSKKDLYLIPIGIAAYVTEQHMGKRDHNLTLEEITLLNRNDINRFDRNATYHWNRSADKFSDVLYKTAPFLPMTLAIPQLKNKNWDNTVTLGVMYIEVFLFTKGITGITKSLVGRTRPYLYNTAFTPEERLNFQGNEAPKASTSFFSGHSSGTFAFAVLFSKTYTDIYGKGTWSTVIWGTSLTLATLTAVSRVAAGEHFPTDVFVGAVVGSAIGYGIPALHKLNSQKLSLNIFPGYLRIAYTL